MKDSIVFSTFHPEENTSDTIILSCHTVRKELEHAMQAVGANFPVAYLESKLHDTPEQLRKVLQEQIDAAGKSGVRRILLGYATCGNSVAGLRTGSCELILPRTDDCVTFFLGSMDRRRKMPAGTFYVTHGWLYDEGHGQSYYQEILEKYGEETGQEIYEMMMEHYQDVGVLDTHCYEMEQLKKDAHAFAECLGLGYTEIDASNSYLEQLLTGPWEKERFFIFGPDHCITEEELFLP